jgi:RNA polymerase sigma-70 factor, ECF subfamily
MPADPTEEELMSAYVAGDRRAFSTLFDLLAPRLLSFFRRSVADAGMAEDMLQATFLRVHSARHNYRNGAPVRPWLFTIAARVRIDALRRRYRLPASAGEDELDRLAERSPATDPGAGLDQSARDLRVRQAIDRLPASQRTVVHLHRFEGMSFAEIGAVLGANEGAVRIRAFRAYATLRAQLKTLVQEEEAP